jgi:hypothetical protein
MVPLWGQKIKPGKLEKKKENAIIKKQESGAQRGMSGSCEKETYRYPQIYATCHASSLKAILSLRHKWYSSYLVRYI